MRITLPTKLSEVTIEMYQRYQRVNKEQKKHKYQIEVIKALTIKGEADFSNVPLRQIKDVAERLESIMSTEEKGLKYKVKINGKKYGINPNLSQCTAAEYAEAMQLTQGGDEELHNLMQVLIRPIVIEKKKSYRVENYEYSEERAELFKKKLTMDVVTSVYVFFSIILLNYKEEIASYGKAGEGMTSMN